MNPPSLIAITAPRVINESTGQPFTPEEFIAYTARISNPSNQHNTATTEKLLTYLVKHSHWSPFDMVDMIVSVETSKAIAIQILRHWSFRFQEFSQRYAEVSALSYDHIEIREKAAGGNRQGSGEENENMSNTAKRMCDQAAITYRGLIDDDAAAESARMVLPMATLSTLYIKGSVRSWMTYFWQRCDPHAQKEHRDLAMRIFKIFRENFPCLASLVESHKPQVIETDWMND